jgi:hypothetical protein
MILGIEIKLDIVSDVCSDDVGSKYETSLADFYCEGGREFG